MDDFLTLDKIVKFNNAIKEALTEPFTGNVDKKMSKEELIRAIRLDITAEEDAINLYTAHADACSDAKVRKVLLDIADEEKVHVGELQGVLNRIAGDSKFIEEGLKEQENI